ncbi:hypothetical protein [Neolewinella maritima]|nr:hypothetical protein [Neolewinella maritima]
MKPIELPSRRTYIWVLGVAAFCALAVGGTFLIAEVNDLSAGTFTRDPLAISSLPWYTGYLSQLTAMCWAGTSSIALFAGTVSKRLGRVSPSSDLLIYLGAFALLMGLDDVLMLHEGLAKTVGIPEEVFYLTYAGLSAGCWWLYRGVLEHTPYLLLLVTLACFALSVLDDVVGVPLVDPFLFEDGFKFMGVISWLAYHYRLGLLCLRIDPATT